MTQKTLSEFSPSDAQCPTCGDEFKNRNGMKVHHKRTHGSSISELDLACPECGKDSFDSMRGFNSHWGQTHEGPTPESIDTSYGTHSQEHRENLSEALQGNEISAETRQALSDALSGRTHDPEFVEKRVAPQRERIETECETCGCALQRHPHRLEDHDRHFCSTECQGEWVSENQVGQNHPRWTGGPVGYEAIRRHLSDGWWRDIADEIREEYDHECQKCGRHQSELDHSLHVHHIIPIMCGGVNHEDNLIPLCHTCHQEVEKHTRQFTEPHLLKYV